jgi:hypothetical protein
MAFEPTRSASASRARRPAVRMQRPLTPGRKQPSPLAGAAHNWGHEATVRSYPSESTLGWFADTKCASAWSGETGPIAEATQNARIINTDAQFRGGCVQGSVTWARIGITGKLALIVRLARERQRVPAPMRRVTRPARRVPTYCPLPVVRGPWSVATEEPPRPRRRLER